MTTAPPSTDFASTLTAKSRHIRVGAQELYTLTLTPRVRPEVNGPWLVFLHEGLGCTAMWHDFPHRLVQTTQRPALVYDRQGYGRSAPRRRAPGLHYLKEEAETLLPALLARMDIEAPVLIGHSDGGTIALLYAALHPRRVKRVITEAAHVLVEPITIKGIRTTVEAFQRGGLHAQLARYHGGRTREVFYHWADIWLADAFRSWNIEACLPRIRCDVLVMQGRDDPYGSLRQVKAITDGIGSQARPCLIPSCGHAPHREKPRRTLAAMRDFILYGHRSSDATTESGTLTC